MLERDRQLSGPNGAHGAALGTVLRDARSSDEWRLRDRICFPEEIDEWLRSNWKIFPPPLLDAEEDYLRVLDIQKFVETLPHIAWITNPQGAGEFINRQWTDYTGQSSPDCLPTGWQDAIHPKDRDEMGKRWMAALESGEAYEVVCRIRARSGEYRWFLARANPVKASDSRVLKWVGTCTDIHERYSAGRAQSQVSRGTTREVTAHGNEA